MNKDFVFHKIAEGKTKIIWQAARPDEVLIENKNTITAGDGERRDQFIGKGYLATSTTCNIFELRKNGVPTHYKDRKDSNSFLAHRMIMIPIELVGRRIAAGSFLKRNPQVHEGSTLTPLVIEFFLKDDAGHDPMLEYDSKNDKWLVFDAKKPRSIGFIRELPLIAVTGSNGNNSVSRRIGPYFLDELRVIAEKVFVIIEQAWRELNITLVDLKIECGFFTDNKGLPLGEIGVGDVIDNDNWRIWPNREKSLDKSKQLYRDSGLTAELIKNYKWVAKASSIFLQKPCPDCDPPKSGKQFAQVHDSYDLEAIPCATCHGTGLI